MLSCPCWLRGPFRPAIQPEPHIAIHAAIQPEPGARPAVQPEPRGAVRRADCRSGE